MYILGCLFTNLSLISVIFVLCKNISKHDLQQHPIAIAVSRLVSCIWPLSDLTENCYFRNPITGGRRKKNTLLGKSMLPNGVCFWTWLNPFLTQSPLRFHFGMQQALATSLCALHTSTSIHAIFEPVLLGCVFINQEAMHF